MNNTKLTRFEILQACSTNFLASPLPDDWYDLTEIEQDDFLCDHAWQPLQHFSADQLWQVIESSVDNISSLLQHHNIPLS